MTYKEETYVLDTLKEIQDTIRSPEFKQLKRETHENNKEKGKNSQRRK